MGRWLSRDPIGQGGGLGVHAYGDGRSDERDPSGLSTLRKSLKFGEAAFQGFLQARLALGLAGGITAYTFQSGQSGETMSFRTPGMDLGAYGYSGGGAGSEGAERSTRTERSTPTDVAPQHAQGGAFVLDKHGRLPFGVASDAGTLGLHDCQEPV